MLFARLFRGRWMRGSSPRMTPECGHGRGIQRSQEHLQGGAEDASAYARSAAAHQPVPDWVNWFADILRDPAAQCVRAVDECSAPLEGVGNAGCPLHPRSRVHVVVVEGTRATTSTPESPGIPARNGFTAYFALSSVTGLSCHRRSTDIVLSKPGWADLTPRT
jgi:hypothetical protein